MIIHVKGGRVVDPGRQLDSTGDVYIQDGRFIEKPAQAPDRVIDAAGLAVLPGLIDAHCHLRDPGYEYREDIVSGTRSAARGGFATVACMPNTLPVCDHAALVAYIRDKAEKQGSCRVLPIGAVSKGQQGKELAEIGLMAQAGIVAVSDDGRPIEQADLMRKAMQYAHQFDLKVISHCEDLSLAAGGHMNEGYTATILGLRGIPAPAEEIMVARDLLLAEYLKLPVHLAHLSTARSIELVREAKRRGVQVTAETCPHYFSLTEEACLGYNTQAKMNPPLRTQADVEAVIAGLQDGTLDMIVTDHAPHHADEKELEFGLANNGIVGFETAWGLTYTCLVKPGFLTLSQAVACLTTAPAALFNQQLGSMKPGWPADLMLTDLEQTDVFDKTKIVGKARNTPYDGWKLNGRVVLTMQKGRVTYEA